MRLAVLSIILVGIALSAVLVYALGNISQVTPSYHHTGPRPATQAGCSTLVLENPVNSTTGFNLDVLGCASGNPAFGTIADGAYTPTFTLPVAINATIGPLHVSSNSCTSLNATLTSGQAVTLKHATWFYCLESLVTFGNVAIPSFMINWSP